ncbi:MAG: ArsR/SmtB family transcription factor [Fidelibacterota bacterium]
MTDTFERSCIRSYVDHKKLMFLQSQLTQQRDLNRLAEILAMLGNGTRLKILYALAEGEELCVCDLADVLNKDVSAISHQLRRLRDRGLVTNRRDGMTIYYRLEHNEESKKACELIEMIFHQSETQKLIYTS